MVNILLSQTELEEFDAVSLYIFSAPSANCNSKIVPTELIEKGPFGSHRECSFTFQAENNCIIVPCTFHAEKEAKFNLDIFTPFDSSCNVKELLDTKEVSIEGEWNSKTAGGSTSYSTWRNNPQYVIKSKSRCDLTLRLVQDQKSSTDDEKLHPIGLYVFKDTGKRRLLVRPDDVLISSPCSSLEAIDLKISSSLLQEKEKGIFSCVVMPCTFYPDLETKFSLHVAVPSDVEEIPIIDSYDPFYQQTLSSEWTSETSGGCLNNGKTWRDNPQIQCKALIDTRLMLLLHLPNSKDDTKHSIGFYVTEAQDNSQKTFQLTPDNIVKKAPFRKSFEAYCPFNIEAGKVYNIIPCTFHAGIESSFTFSIFSNQPEAATLSPVLDYKKISVQVCFLFCLFLLFIFLY